MSLKMCDVGSKSMLLGQVLEKFWVCSRGHFFSVILMKLGQNVCLNESRTDLKMGNVRLKTWSLGHILEKPSVHSSGLIFILILMKLDQNVCHD